MCFSSPKAPETPAAAPAPPAPAADQQDVGSTRRAENISAYGGTSPDLRVRDSSASSGGIGSSGAGLKM